MDINVMQRSLSRHNDHGMINNVAWVYGTPHDERGNPTLHSEYSAGYFLRRLQLASDDLRHRPRHTMLCILIAGR